MSPRKKKSDIFFNIFVGEFVQVVTKLQTKTIISTEAEVKEQTLPVIIEGYLLDYDDDYYYIGEETNSINSGIKKEEVAHIHIMELKSEMDVILDEFPVPHSDEEVN